jgi:hypothetical protein
MDLAGGATAMAVALHCAPQKLYNWSAGRSMPSLLSLMDMKALMEIDMNWLLSGEGQPPTAMAPALHANVEAVVNEPETLAQADNPSNNNEE